MASRSFRSTVMIAPLTAYHPLIPGKDKVFKASIITQLENWEKSNLINLLFSFFLTFSFNQLDLPAYESYEKLRHMLLLAIQECSEGFGLA